MVTYPGYTASLRPEKVDELPRLRITAGGHLLEYDGDVTTHTASMETIKAHWNSVVSTKDVCYCTSDISNMYLMSDLVDSEYVKFNYTLIPQRIIDHYKLDTIVDSDFVYAKINKAWYGLKQSGKIAHDDLVKHLNKHDYVQAEHTDGLFTQKLCDISFTLVIDDLGIKYTNKNDVNHLNSIMRSKYKFKVDFDAKQYIGVYLKWDYIKRQVIYSMDGYVRNALEELKHILIAQHHYVPSYIERPDYGAKVQYAKEDHAPPLSATQIKHIERVVEKFLYYGRDIDNTMLHALNDITSTKKKGTQTTWKAIRCQNYLQSKQHFVQN